MRFLLFLFLITISTTYSSHAQFTFACVSDDTGFIYPDNAYGTTYEPTSAQSEGVGPFCEPKKIGTCRIRSRSDCRGCGPRVNEGTWWRPDYWYYQPGTEKRYVACPIDDYIPYALLFVSGIGLFFIRK